MCFIRLSFSIEQYILLASLCQLPAYDYNNLERSFNKNFSHTPHFVLHQISHSFSLRVSSGEQEVESG